MPNRQTALYRMPMLLVLPCLLFAGALAAEHFAEGSAVQWPDGPLPSIDAAEMLVENQRARDQQPWLLLTCSVASCAVLSAVRFLWPKCCGVLASFRACFSRIGGNVGNRDDLDVDFEAGLQSSVQEWWPEFARPSHLPRINTTVSRLTKIISQQ